MTAGEADWGLVLAFDTDDEEFTRGFEAGQLWEALSRGGHVCRTVREENTEMVMRMAEALNMTFTGRDLGDGWLHVQIEPRG
jgi:hypothetical protein